MSDLVYRRFCRHWCRLSIARRIPPSGWSSLKFIYTLRCRQNLQMYSFLPRRPAKMARKKWVRGVFRGVAPARRPQGGAGGGGGGWGRGKKSVLEKKKTGPENF